jgi:hypothetical protein
MQVLSYGCAQAWLVLSLCLTMFISGHRILLNGSKAYYRVVLLIQKKPRRPIFVSYPRTADA